MARINQSSLFLFHLGPGNVGKNFLKQLLENKNKIEKKYQISIKMVGIFHSKGGVFNQKGIDEKKVIKFISTNNKKLLSDISNKQIKNCLNRSSFPLVIVDTTTSEETFSILVDALKKDAFAILSNKKPLSSEMKKFRDLFAFKKRLFFETTVGAGLPIISTLKELMETGDAVINIKGCFSGTLGYIFTLLQKGERFSNTVKNAMKLGFTEPDPRDDLCGLDVARKALILSRLIGENLSLEEIKTQSLYPENLSSVSVDEFLDKINIVDNHYHHLFLKAEKEEKTYRYVANINHNSCYVGVRKVDLKSDIGLLVGPDNMVVIRTKRYYQNPLIIKGPGAGPEVTAAGVFGDLLKIIKIVKGVNI